GGGNTIPTGTTYSWSAPSVVGISGTAAGTNQTSISGSPANTTNAPINVVYVVTPTSGSCSGTPFNVTVTVNPTPTITTINATACSGSSFSVTPANTTNGIVPTGTTYSWAAPSVLDISGAAAGTSQNNITGTLTQSTSSPINVTYTVTPTSGTCVGTAFSVTVAVNPNPVVNNMTTSVCGGVAFSVTPVNGTNGNVPTGTTYTWSAPVAPTGISGVTSGSNSSNVIGTLVNTTNAAINVVYTVTPSLGSCSGTPFTLTVTVGPAPVIAAKTTTICSNGTFTVTPTDGSGSDVVPVGTTYSWAAPSVSGITGTTSGTASADINGTLTNTTNSGINVVFVVTPSFGSCSGMPFNVTVTVNPQPAINDMTATACNGTAFNVIPANGTNGIVPTGTTYVWSAPTTTATGGSAQAIGQVAISQTLTHTSASAVTASYTVTPTSGTCAGNPFTLVVTVSPRPVVSNESTTICSGGTFAVTPASGGSNVIPAGTTYSWAAPSVTGITGTVAGTNAPVIGGSLTNTTNAPINVTYTVTPTVGGCAGATFNVTVTVEPRPAVSSMTVAVCTDNTFNITPVNTTNGIVPAGTTYSWVAPTPPTGITGTASGSNLPSISGTLTNNTNAAINVVYTVTPTSGTCVGSDFPLTVTVNPIPAITPMTATASTGVAFSVSPQTTTNGVVPGGTTYTWATPPTPPGIIGTASGSSQPTISGNLTNTTNSGIDVVYTVTPVIGNCTGAPFSVTVTVLPRPTITAKTVTICSGETFSVCPVNGVNGDIVPLGTTYTWTVTNNVNVLGESNQTSPQSCISQTLTNGSTSSPQIVVYTVTPTSGPLVGNTFTLTVTVNPVPTFTTTKTDPTACNGTDGTVTLVNLTPNTTFNYTIIGGSLPFTVSPPVSSNASGQIVIPNLGAGNYTITVINSTNCESTPRTVTLNNPGAPNVNDIADVLVCGTSYTLPTISGTNLPTAGNGTVGFFSFPNGVGSLTGTITSLVASTQTVYIYAATPGGCSDEESFVLTINPIPVVNVATATVCVNQTITLTATSSGAPTVGTWSSLNPTFASVNPITGVVTGHIAGTASIIMTETGTNCASSATLVTIKALPTVSAGPNQTICSNSSATLAGVLGGSATAGVWSGGSGSFVPSNTASNAVYTPTSLEILADSVILIYSTVDVTCSSVSDSVIIYIQDLPTVNAGANQTICSTSTALLGGTIGGSASSVTWTSSGAPGTLTSANTLTPTYTPVLADVVPTGITLTMTSNDPIGPCPAVTSTVLITVNPAATVNAGADFPACSKYAIPLAGLIGGSATSATWSGAGTYSPSNSDTSQYTPTAAELLNPFLDLTLTTNDPIGPCPAVTDVVRVTFAAPAIANAGPDQTICSGLPVNVVGTVSGTASSGVWKNANTWGSPIPVGLNITYNPSTTEVNNNLAVLFVETNDPPGPCPIERDTVLININPTPFLLGNNQFGSCTNSALNIPLTVGGGLTPITTFQWSATDNPNVSGESLGTFSSDTIPDVLINTNPLLVHENVIYNVTPTIGTCVGTPVILTVTVLPRPTMQPVADQIVCANTLTSAVNFVANIPTTSFNWTNTLPSIKNPPLNPSNGNIPSFTAINNTGDTLEATICVTPSTNLASPATTCPGTTECFKISVKPISTVNDPVDQVICAGQSTNSVIFTSSDPNTIYNWTSVTSPNNNIGLAPSGQGNINSFVGVNNGTVPVVATITVTPELNGCLGIPQTFTITVKPLPVMQTISDRTVCVGNVSNTIPFVAVPSGTTYVWTATNHAITGIPSATNTTNSFPSFTAVNVTDTVIPSLVHVVPTFNGCAGTPVDFTIFVNPILKADSIENFVFCEGETFPTRCITGNAPGVIYTWSNNNTAIGLPNIGSTCIPSFVLVASNQTELASITITPNLSGCQGIPTVFTITVKPKPNVYISQPTQGNCHNLPTIPVIFTSDVFGTTFTWINTDNMSIQTGTTLPDTSFGNVPSFLGQNAISGISQTALYKVIPTVNSCFGDTSEFTITVDPVPTVNHVADQTVCAGQPTVPVTFTGNLPNGTVYNWDATAQAIYPTTWTIPGTGSIPSFVPPTNDLPYTVTSKVTVTPVFGFCTGAKDSLFFNIKPKPRVNQIPNQALCVGATTQAVNLSGNMDLPLSEGPADYVWSNDNSTIGLADDGVNNIAPFIALNPGNIVITSTIDVTPHFNGCTGDTMSFTITTVAPIPIANPVPDQILCAGETTDLITFVNPNVSSYPQTSFIWSNDNPIGCASSDTTDASDNFEIPPFPTVGGFTPIVSTFDVIPYYAGCAGDTMSFSITVKPVPNVFVSPQTQQACAGLPTQTVVFTGNVAGTSYDWTSNAAFTGSGSGGNGNVQSFTAVNNTTNIITNMIICTPSLNQCVGDPDTAYIYVNPTTTVVLQQHNYSYCHGDSIPQICFVGNNPATE
ncbi:MAG: hypothetical protein EBU01_02235, partial [Crocinitomicaceae bacterium]|nr:hypothetical protein [Crocinitomicaceae bacterium]